MLFCSFATYMDVKKRCFTRLSTVASTATLTITAFAFPFLHMFVFPELHKNTRIPRIQE